MRVLLIHKEAAHFAGAEVLLGYFLEEVRSHPCQITVAVVGHSRTASVIPKGVPVLALPENTWFSPRKFTAQIFETLRSVRNGHFDLLHGWAARDWELTALVGALTRCPTVGTLHDDPQARFLSPKRQRLMRWCANRGLKRLICISEAVKSACITAGYDPARLTTVHNGLPRPTRETWQPGTGPVRLGFIGALGERKGLRGLFQMLEHLSQISSVPWEMFIAGEAIEADGEALVKALRAEYSNRAWYSRLHWCGWVDRPLEFLSAIDLLICPSSEFEPFGLVLCEAGWMGLPVLGTRVGGIPEIVEDGKTGWLIDVGNWRKGAERLAEAVGNRALRRSVGDLGRQRVQKHFAIEKMVAEYLRVWASILPAP